MIYGRAIGYPVSAVLSVSYEGLFALACNSINSTLEIFTVSLLIILMVSLLLRKSRTFDGALLFGLLVIHALNTSGDLISWRLAGEPGEVALFFTTLGTHLFLLRPVRLSHHHPPDDAAAYIRQDPGREHHRNRAGQLGAALLQCLGQRPSLHVGRDQRIHVGSLAIGARQSRLAATGIAAALGVGGTRHLAQGNLPFLHAFRRASHRCRSGGELLPNTDASLSVGRYIAVARLHIHAA